MTVELPLIMFVGMTVIMAALIIWVATLYYQIHRHLRRLTHLNGRFMKAYVHTMNYYEKTHLPLLRTIAHIFEALYIDYSDTIRTF